MKLLVKDMTCGHCASVITQAIKALDTMAQIEIDLSSKTVTISTNANKQDILTAVSEEGYTPELIEA